MPKTEIRVRTVMRAQLYSLLNLKIHHVFIIVVVFIPLLGLEKTVRQT